MQKKKKNVLSDLFKNYEIEIYAIACFEETFSKKWAQVMIFNPLGEVGLTYFKKHLGC
jgi:hypothetical protein